VKTLVVGLGNPILCDDGVGNQTAMALAGRIDRSDITVIETSRAGMDFIDMATGYDKVIIIDAIITGKAKPGQVYRLDPESLDATLHTSALHDITLSSAIKLAKKLTAKMPEDIVIYGVEVQDIETFSESCTPEVRAAIPVCMEQILRELGEEDSKG
jgi:hydrogenase maturation protease